MTVAKFFLSAATQGPDGVTSYRLGAVCRGEINKDWAAATPSGSLEGVSDPVLDLVWQRKLSGLTVNPEVHVFVEHDDGGDWKFDSCSFSYGGCQAVWSGQGEPYGRKMSMTVNNAPATQQLRESFANGLLAGIAPRYTVRFEDASMLADDDPVA